MSLAWLDQPERGSRTTIRLFTWLTLRFGHSLGRILLYPISLYFIIFSVTAKRSSYAFLSRIFGRPAKWKEAFKHYYTYACTMHDRIYLLTGRSSQFNIKLTNSHLLEPLVNKKRGFILLGAHLGSFEILRSYGVLQKGLNVSVLMSEKNSDKSNSVLHELFPAIKEGIIQPGEPGTILKIKERLDEGGIVGILGDRMFSNSKAVQCDFLGGQASFPQGPIKLAATLQMPVVLFFGIYHGGVDYEICFEHFSDSLNINPRSSENIQPWVQRYAAKLEHYARLYPYNWFNFYDFWHEKNK